MQKIKKGDDVVVLAGKDRGKRGSVLRILKDGRVLVDSVNIVKKHVRPNPNKGDTGGIIERESPMDISNLAIYNAESDKPDRVGFKIAEDGKKIRIFKSSGEPVDS